MGSHQVNQGSSVGEFRRVGHGGELAGGSEHQFLHQVQVRIQQVVRVLCAAPGMRQEGSFEVDAANKTFVRKLHVKLYAAQQILPRSGDHAGQERGGSRTVEESGCLPGGLFLARGKVPAVSAMAMDIHQAWKDQVAGWHSVPDRGGEAGEILGVEVGGGSGVSDAVAVDGQEAVLDDGAVRDQSSRENLEAGRGRGSVLCGSHAFDSSGLRHSTREGASEEPGLTVIHAAHGVIIQGDAINAAVVGQDLGLGLDLLGGKDAPYGSKKRIAVEQFQVTGQLFHAVNIAAALQLDGYRASVGVPGKDVYRPDCREVLPPYQ